ncbi:MAG: 4Fe-4S dicluster domain-containing protein [Bryobacterales bacterium]|nr:4Fe-4S dicluster domain-containing protein [Bryobacterales bacterium]
MSEPTEGVRDRKESTGRRRFFHALASLGSGAVAGLVGAKIVQPEQAEAAEVPASLTESSGTLVLRMQQDLEQTIASGRTPSWLMVVDTRKCIGCDSCTVACRAENPTGPGGNFRRVIQLEQGAGPAAWAIFKPVNCLHCDNPPCARAVPAGMIWKRPDGIVEFDHAKLKGPYARAAAEACPVRLVQIDDGKTFTETTPAQQPYEIRSFVENGQVQTRKKGSNAMNGAARKCTFCSHLLDISVLPACVSTCVGGAMYFGDANNAGSLIREITQGRRTFRGHQNLGLTPRVIYFEEPVPEATHIDCSVCHY